MEKKKKKNLTYSVEKKINDPKRKTVLFVWFDSLRPSQQFYRYIGTCLQGLNQY